MRMSYFSPSIRLGHTAPPIADESRECVLQFSRSRSCAPVGKHSVSIRAARGEELEDGDVGLARVQVPEKYNSATELQREVKPGRNVHDFDLDIPVALTSVR
jgi:hypothetical protein